MESYWIDSIKSIKKDYEKLEKNLDVDVCIIGGGITGISTAYYLKNSGLNVCVLEKEKLCSHTTGNTTGKITSQHDLFYKYLIDSDGKEFARQYLKAHEKAIKEISQIIYKENIECDFELQDAYVFTQKLEGISRIKDEVEAVSSLYTNKDFICEYVEDTQMPINALGAMKFSKQAQFHPLKYILGLINSMPNVKIYENTKIIDLKKKNNSYRIIAENGYEVTSKYVVIATNYPIINIPGYYFLKMYQEMSYIIAIKPNGKIYDGMYISCDEPKVSIRNHNDIVLIGGINNKTGAKIDSSNSYNFLERIAKQIYPNYELKYKWCTQDSISLDKIPYIGKFSSLMPNVYIGTGYKKWGMTASNISAQLISSQILGKKYEYEDVFTSTRFEPIKNIAEVKNMFKETVNSLIFEKINISKDLEKNIEINEGKILEIDGKKVGAYKNEKGQIYMINPICSHLGCELSWNNAEKTWDCPCHGSRFDYTGKSIYSPSVKDIKCWKK